MELCQITLAGQTWAPGDFVTETSAMLDPHASGDPRQDDPQFLHPGLSVSQFYDRFVRPVCLVSRGASGSHLKLFADALRYWKQFTGDPPLDRINQWTCAEFVRRVSGLPGNRKGSAISPNTVRRHAQYIQRVLDLAGPPGRHNRMAQDLLARVPYVERPPAREKPPEDAYTLAEVALWLAATPHARQPRGLPYRPSVWWDSLIRFLLNAGTRIECTMALEHSMIREGCWLVIPWEIYKGKRHGQKVFLNQSALQAIARVKVEGDPHLFPWPYTLDYLQSCRRKILAKSELPADRRMGFHALRKALATNLAEIDGRLAQVAMGHTAFATTKGSYINRRAVASAYDRLPQP